MKIIISGGTGLIGSALTQSLQKRGHQVVIISRDPNQTIPGVKLISWDPDSLSAGIESADAVVNLAGASLAGNNPFTMRWTARRKARIIDSRVQAGSLLVEAIKRAKNKPDVLIQASAIGYYGNQGPGEITENSPAGKDFLAQVCLPWEGSTAEVEELGLRRVIARIGLVLSSGGGLLRLLALPTHFFLGGRIGGGKQIMSWIHISDLVRSLEFFLDQPQTQGIYNLTAPRPVTNEEFISTLGRILNRPTWLPIPAFLLNIGLGEAATMALHGREVYPEHLLGAGFDFNFKDLPSALGEIYQ